MQTKNRLNNDYIFTINISKKINALNSKCKTLKKLSDITNTIMSNLHYADKNREKQFNQIKNLGLSTRQIELLDKAWDVKKKMQNYYLMN